LKAVNTIECILKKVQYKGK